MAKTVTVNATRALVLRLEELQEGPLGIKTAVRVGNPVVLQQGANEVDLSFMKTWMELHAQDDIVLGNVVTLGPESGD